MANNDGKMARKSITKIAKIDGKNGEHFFDIFAIFAMAKIEKK